MSPVAISKRIPRAKAGAPRAATSEREPISPEAAALLRSSATRAALDSPSPWAIALPWREVLVVVGALGLAVTTGVVVLWAIGMRGV